jgi:acetate kinase
MTVRSAILSLNLGSSSFKYAAYDAHAMPSAQTLILAGSVAIPRKADFAAALDQIETEVRASAAPLAIGHRVVFGGEHVAPEPITEALLARLDALSAIAPLHLPPEVAAIRATGRRFAAVPQVACFDTAFHAAMPSIAMQLPVDRELWNKGLRRYGFHGVILHLLQQGYDAQRLGRLLRRTLRVARGLLPERGHGGPARRA